MDNKVKTLFIASLVTLFVTSCTSTNGRYALGGQQASQDKQGVTHTHNGVAHTHLLPEGGLSHSHNYNTSSAPNVVTTTPTTTSNTQPPVVTSPVGTCAPCRAGTTRNVVNAPAATTTTTTTNGGGNCHVHSGRRHCHPLPATGTSHQHGQGTGGGGTTKDVVNTGSQQPASTYYDYSGGSATGGSYYNYGGSGGSGATTSAGGNGVSHSHGTARHAHALPASGLNHTHNRGSGTGDTYSAYASGGGGTTVAASGASGGNTYIVKGKNTVFQVMRSTGVYWKTIIKLNNLRAPDYVITPGQALRLK